MATPGLAGPGATCDLVRVVQRLPSLQRGKHLAAWLSARPDHRSGQQAVRPGGAHRREDRADSARTGRPGARCRCGVAAGVRPRAVLSATAERLATAGNLVPVQQPDDLVVA